jgi:hypothetical protein
MRVTLAKNEVEDLISLLGSNSLDFSFNTCRVSLLEKLKDEMEKPVKISKQKATRKATISKINTAKRKLESTVNLMRLEGKKININSVSRESGLAYNTVKKYSGFFIRK